jgi:DNA replication ATP-dependent helicase Dna2
MNTSLLELESLFRRIRSEMTSPKEQCKFLLKVYHDLVLALSEVSSLHFNTLFARVSFITARYPMSKGWAYALQIPRREIQHREIPDEQLCPILHECIHFLFQLSRYEDDPSQVSIDALKPPPVNLPGKRRTGKFKKKFARVIALEWDKAQKWLTIMDEEEPAQSIILHYCVPGVNDLFAETLELALEEVGLPMILGLTGIEHTDEGHYVASYIVILPDLLIDVTSITQVKSHGSDPQAINLMDGYLPSQASEAIMTGNIANYFLDELIRDHRQTFDELFANTFQLYPIEFVKMSDDQVRNLYRNLKNHYSTIAGVIADKFPTLGIDAKYCVIEPSYFSPRFGIKGRLDLYFEREDNQTASIIELKSNTPFKPNSYGLSNENYQQTLLYDLLIRSTDVAGYHRANYILYSAVPAESLRYAVSVEALQKETIQYRNELVLLQFRLMRQDNANGKDIFLEIDPGRYESTKGYVKRNIEQWHTTYSALSPGEQYYFRAFSAFITREHMLARIGSERGDGAGGLAGLWLDKLAVKEERYQILQGLKLVSVDHLERQTIIRFSKTKNTNPLANFRIGDIVVMYPHHPGEYIDPTRYQLHRANVINVDATEVAIRLYNSQVHTGQIEKYMFWNLEHDLLDSSFRSLYQSLWALMGSHRHVSEVILGLVPPVVQNRGVSVPVPGDLTSTQASIYQEGIQAGMLYLLWGPPGTGKTSMMLRSWVWYYVSQTKSRIVLLAYTNKAVDEICEALHALGEGYKDHYIRIGSRAATGEPYKDRLLENVIRPFTKRKEIRRLLEETRIFVATVSSLQGKSELFNILSFDVAIIDEASQLLEPALVGLLTRFKKTILIGDHKQLPAVSIQPEALGKVKPDQHWTERIGLSDMSMSYFERLYRLYQKNGWNEHIGILSEQGRMHPDIMAFVNQFVYDGSLTCLVQNHHDHLWGNIKKDNSSPLFQSRLIFIPTQSTLEETYLKTNQHEASVVVRLLVFWSQHIQQHKLQWTIGVITPFRAQIAAISYCAHQLGVDLKNITIDTVERYQGGARDIIIMSAAVNSSRSLSRITSVSTDGADRKLNVAVTRARQQFILVGDQTVLQNASSYQALISQSKIIEPDFTG